ncbi:MAG: hypothetical protein R3246_08250, partial [Acidimicrobiia bacterium]|nr:hypothetical protein [Acidimicrobiia bacterium]
VGVEEPSAGVPEVEDVDPVIVGAHAALEISEEVAPTTHDPEPPADAADTADDVADSDPGWDEPEPDWDPQPESEPVPDKLEVPAEEGGFESDPVPASDPSEFEDDTSEGDPDALDDGRFGGSALDRLSAAIGSLRAGGADDETMSAEGDDDDGEYVLGPNTVATDVLETQRALREHRLKVVARGKWLKVGAVVVAVAAIVALFAFLTPPAIDFLRNYESEPDVPVTSAPTTTPPTTVAPTTTLAPEETVETAPAALPTGAETIFDLPSPEFVAAWEAAGGPIDEVLLFDQLPTLGPFSEQFTPFLSMEGIVAPDGTVDEFQLVIDPTGPAEYDRISIQALGVAIATVDPERSPEGRATLLGQLGLNVRQPQLEGIDGSIESAGIAYTLVYDAAANLLTLSVAPAS